MIESTHHYIDFFLDFSQHFLASNCDPFKDMVRSIVNRRRCPNEVHVGKTTYEGTDEAVVAFRSQKACLGRDNVQPGR
jgi:hypothetical protein